MSEVLLWTGEVCEPSRPEILRYMGEKAPSEAVLQLLDACMEETRNSFSQRVCYASYPMVCKEGCIDLGFCKTESKDLAKCLKNCDRAVVFAATVGMETDRLVAKYGRISPAKALCMQAIGTERIEALCDAFCASLRQSLLPNECLRPRFSPGYGDLPIEMQREIFSTLDCQRKIGLYLRESLLMSPTKSVTAIVGIGKEDL